MSQAPAVQPDYTPSPIPTNWECHHCKKGPMLYVNTKKCPTCQHKICKDCKCDSAIETPLGPTPAAHVRSLLQATNLDIFPTARIPSIYHHMGDTSSQRPRRKKLCARPVDMTRWWYCCDGHLNNPELASMRCSQCPHYKCVRCRPAPRR